MHTSKSQLSKSRYVTTLYAIILTQLFVVGVLIAALHSFAAWRHFGDWPLLPGAWRRGDTCILAGGGLKTLCCRRPHHCSLYTGSMLGDTWRFCPLLPSVWWREDWLNVSAILDVRVATFLVVRWLIWVEAGVTAWLWQRFDDRRHNIRMSAIVKERVFFCFARVVPLLFVFCLWHLGSSYEGWLWQVSCVCCTCTRVAGPKYCWKGIVLFIYIDHIIH